jgi:hypothetical protein
MTAFLQETTSVQVLELNISCFGLPDDSRLMLAGALASNTHVTDLTLYFEVDKDNDVCASVMHVLCNNTRLQQLNLEFERDDDDDDHDDDDHDDGDPYFLVPGHVWSSLLQSGIPLRSLSLRSMRFDRDAMTHLLHGLNKRDTAIDLQLVDCFFKNCVIDALVDLAPTIFKSLVSQLTVDCPSFPYERDPRWIKTVDVLNPISGPCLSNNWPLEWTTIRRVAYLASWLSDHCLG